MSERQLTMHKIGDRLIVATNTFDTDRALAMFTQDAVIDDPSTGHRFIGRAGIRDYIEQYFVGYHTTTRVLSAKTAGPGRMILRVDFTGDFGHEIGILKISINADGLISRIDANLEG